MLEFSYSQHYAQVVSQTEWDIELPDDWKNFFNESGVAQLTADDDDRSSQRRIVRTHGLMLFEDCLPAIPRPSTCVGVFTRDFSKDACGMISPFELFPQECVRLILPTFWLSLRVVRTCRITSTCFQVGMRLLQRHDPNQSAFEVTGELIGAS